MSCPICQSPPVRAYRPFCSRRCADLDLGNWLNGAYSLPSEDAEVPDNAGPGDTPPLPKPH